MAGVLRSVLTRARALPPFRLDALLGLAVWFELCAELVLATPLTGPRLAVALAGAGATFGAAIALRRRAPLAAIGLAGAGVLLGTRFGPEVTDHTTTPFFVVVFVAYSVGAHLDGRRVAAGFGIGATLVAASILSDPAQNQDAAFLFAPAFTIGAPVLFGQLLRNRIRLNQALRERARRDERGRAAEAEAAAQEERTRIAGELHDVVAHALSAMTVQASAARRLTASHPDRAATAFAAVEGTGREALTELRRLLGVLRKADEELALAPQPSLANVDGLAHRATASGLPVEVTVRGAARTLPAGVDLTAYRVVQEALNHARDAGFAGRATVEIAYDDGHVSVEVRDDGAAEGRRLLGTRERVAVYGGELWSTAQAGGGWRVTATLPAEVAV